MTKISGFFLLSSISTLFLGKISIFGSLKISGLLLLISFIFFLIALIKKELNILQEKKIIFYLLISAGFLLIGTTLGLIIYKNISIITGIKGFIYASINLVVLIEIILISNSDKTFPGKILLSFLFSLLIIPFIYISGINKFFLLSGNRFEGLLGDPNYFVNFQIIPTLLLLYFIMKENIKIILKIFLFILLCFSVGLILWSGSRAGLLGLMASFISLAFLFFVSDISKKKLFIIILLMLLSLPIGYYIIPQKSRNDISVRITNMNTQPATIEQANTKIITDITSGQDRFNIWKNSLPYIIKNPLGYGNEYSDVINIIGDGYGHRVVHNSELEILLTGGICLFILINLALLKIIIKSIKNCYKQKFNEIHILLPILIGVLISSLFIDALFQRWIWIIVALLIVYNRQLSETKTL